MKGAALLLLMAGVAFPYCYDCATKYDSMTWTEELDSRSVRLRIA
jgi:hypothetical protein